VSYMKKQMGPSISTVDSADALEAFKPTGEADPVVIGFGAADSELATFITALAKKKRDDFAFGLVTDAAVAGDHMGSVVMFKSFDELKNVYTGDLEDDKVMEFLNANSMPSCAEIGPGNYQKYLARGLPLSWLFLGKDEDSEAVLEGYKSVAPEFKAKLSLVHLDGEQYKQMAQKMGLSGDKLPGLSIEDADGAHWVYPETEELTKESMEKWLTQWVAGELSATVKSEPVPTSLTDEHNVATLVGENFKEVALDEKKDVLIEFYAPWCGHCKSLIPIWDKLGTAFKGIDSVVIAKTDATANDYPAGFKVEGFPTIKFIKSVDNAVEDYKGGRELDAFVAYIKENAATKFELSAAAEAAASADNDNDNDEL